MEYANATVSVCDVWKNNAKKTGVTVLPNGSNAGPTIYMEDFFDAEKEFSEVMAYIKKVFAHAFEYSLQFDVGNFNDQEWIKSNLFCKLVKGSNNDDFLCNLPHKTTPFGELVLLLNVEADECRVGTATVTDSLYEASIFGLFDSLDDAFEVALNNTARMCPPVIETIEAILIRSIAAQSGISEEVIRADLEEGYGAIEKPQLYVITNNTGVNGAAVMLYPGIMKKVSEEFFEGGNYVILPSSVHEMLAAPAESLSPHELVEMVAMVNKQEVMPEEVLAEDAFLYRADTGEIIKMSDMMEKPLLAFG